MHLREGVNQLAGGKNVALRQFSTPYSYWRCTSVFFYSPVRVAVGLESRLPTILRRREICKCDFHHRLTGQRFFDFDFVFSILGSKCLMPSPKISFKDPWRRPDVSIDQRPSYNTMESHHDRASAGSSQTDRRVKKAAHRSSNLTISLSPRTSRSSYPVASPQKPSARSVPNIAVPPEATVQRAMSANAHLPLMRSPDTLDHFSLTDPYAPQPEESRDPSVGHAEIPGERSASAATVRGPSACERGPTPPLTPFPPWVGNSDDGEESEAREWEGPHHQRDHPTNKRGNEGHGHEHHVAHEKKWLFSSVIHGVVLALQAATALAIFSAMAFIIVWKKNKGEADFWSWYAYPTHDSSFIC